jgi:formate hydrogenlyase subunit 3/multisubunit Na+/H+ antiporter MnhD subunit
MSGILLALAVLLLGSTLGCFFTGAPRRQALFGPVVLWLAAGLSLCGTLPVLLGGTVETFRTDWDMPVGTFLSTLHLRLDALAALFLLPVFLVPATAALAAAGYTRERADAGQGNGGLWFFLPLLVAAMAVVVLARDAVLFLIAWEVMSVAAFFLLTAESERPEVEEAGWSFLVAAHLGGACLLAFFVLLGSQAHSFDLDVMAETTLPTPLRHAAFALALIGFGTKAGVVPLHSWLPRSYPPAPRYLPAILSGAMSKLGIFGLLLTLGLLGTPDLSWAWTLLALGLLTGLFGVAHALTQPRLKTLLAYSSIENIGIILLGLGTGMLAQTSPYSFPHVLGYAAALVHVLNHALVKTLLFLGLGAIEQATGTDRIDELGGLMQRLPLLSTCFTVGCVTLAALPPFTCFTSEFLLILGAFEQLTPIAGHAALLPFLVVIAGVALIAGLAVAAFTRAAGLALLGTPRSPSSIASPAANADNPRPAPLDTVWVLPVLATLCLLGGLLAPYLVDALTQAVSIASKRPVADVSAVLGESGAISWLTSTSTVLGLFLALLAALILLRRYLLQGREVGATSTWGCGYAQLTARMQYTSSSYAQPLAELVGPLVGKRVDAPEELPYFPVEAEASTTTTDLALEAGYKPAFAGLRAAFGALRFLQSGTVHVYILYIAATLLVLLLWMLG